MGDLAGSIYIITNPVWPDWTKVGRATDLESRLSSYQTGSPFRDYELRVSWDVFDAPAAEAAAFEVCDEVFGRWSRRNEWIKTDWKVVTLTIRGTVEGFADDGTEISEGDAENDAAASN